VHFSRSLCTNVAGEAWRAAGSGLRRAMCWRSLVMGSAGSTGLALGISSSPGILKGSPYTSSATDACRSSLKENRGKRLCPLLVHVVNDGCLQCPVEAFHESVSRGVVGCRPRELNATHFCQGLEKLQFKVPSLVCGDGLFKSQNRVKLLLSKVTVNEKTQEKSYLVELTAQKKSHSW
jgi:hypothetical protein